MRNTALFLIILFSSICVKAQSWSGSTPGSIYYNQGNVGIGTLNPSEKLTISGGHIDTKLRLFSTGNGGDSPSNLSLWASEPGWTYYGTGIGYNVNGSPYYGRIDNARGSSYVRFLPTEIKFEFQNSVGNYLSNTFVIKEGGNVGIGTPTPNARLDLGTGYGNNGEKFLIYNDDNSAPLAGTKVGFYMDRFSLSNNSTFVFPTHTSYPGSFIIASKNTTNTTLLPRITVLGENGFVGIGTTFPAYKLDVSGTIRAKEIKVESGWADFVFNDNYKLPSLSEVGLFINEHKHLPNIPSAKEVEEKGVNLGEMNALLLQKIEELTLYMLEQKKEITALKIESDEMKSILNLANAQPNENEQSKN